MKLFVLAATLAVAFAAPQITSTGDDITVTGKSIKFSEVSCHSAWSMTKLVGVVELLPKPLQSAAPSHPTLGSADGWQHDGRQPRVHHHEGRYSILV